VKKAVEKEITAHNKNNESIQYWSQIFESIFKGIANSGTLIKAAVIFIISLFIFIILFFLLRNIFFRSYRSKKSAELEIKNESSVFDTAALEKLVNENKFSDAIIYLHRCSVFYLIKTRIIYSSNMTNSSIYYKIQITDQKNAFKNIYGFSEKILFDEYKALHDDLLICRDAYMKYFIKESI
jgi:hypothetical protein